MEGKQTSDRICYRDFGSRRAWRVELLFWNEESPTTRTDYPKERIKIQNGVQASRRGSHISDPCWNGNLASISLNSELEGMFLYGRYDI